MTYSCSVSKPVHLFQLPLTPVRTSAKLSKTTTEIAKATVFHHHAHFIWTVFLGIKDTLVTSIHNKSFLITIIMYLLAMNIIVIIILSWNGPLNTTLNVKNSCTSVHQPLRSGLWRSHWGPWRAVLCQGQKSRQQLKVVQPHITNSLQSSPHALHTLRKRTLLVFAEENLPRRCSGIVFWTL